MKKNILITGGTSGIGRAIANKIKDENIIITYNENNKEANNLKLKNIDVYKCDLSNENEIKNLYNNIIDKYGSIDVLINNAGIAIDTLFEDKTKENFMKTIEINLVGTFLMSKYFGMNMYEKKSGKIINISSTNGIDTNYPMSIDYDASKAGVNSLTNNLALQFAPYVIVNTVAPGWVMTEMNKELDSEFIEIENKKILLNRFARPEEIANVVNFLVSEESNYINNSIIRVDGGKR